MITDEADGLFPLPSVLNIEKFKGKTCLYKSAIKRSEMCASSRTAKRNKAV